VRDYFYIEDGVGSIPAAREKMDDPRIHGEAFNFSNELQITVTEMVNKVLEAMKATETRYIG